MGYFFVRIQSSFVNFCAIGARNEPQLHKRRWRRSPHTYTRPNEVSVHHSTWVVAGDDADKLKTAVRPAT